MKKSYFENISPWYGWGENLKKEVRAWICWYRVGGKVRGTLQYQTFDTKSAAESFAATLEK